MDISVLIVSWNVLDLLDACIRSILANTAPGQVEILVIDSASTDRTAEHISAAFPGVRLFAQSENIGFTKGTNLALGEARGRYLMLLNPDTVIIGDALLVMQQYLDTHPGVGMVGPHTLNPDGTTQSSRRRFPTLVTAIFESTWLQGYAPPGVLERFYVTDTPEDATIEVDWVQGSALMARREVYEQIGGLDEGYIMYSEEMDWCRRAKDAGWRVAFLGDARIIHHGGKSTDQVVARRHIHFQESKLRYFRKYHGALAANGLRLFLLTSYAVQIGIEAAKGMLGLKRPLRRERVRQYLEVLRSGLKVT
ncbi:MAG: glycosyltransferase family 2 protein [Anaerolineae bacterium]|nr:glycosyltransferase family 2 protein [Anaerolineae bacterium]NUQ02381.1 glycosyltransferase family 2 protein [Anaerolineae bacterium]